MLQTEYIRNLNCNYERLLLEEKPEEKKYQYCILTRGGIKGLLPCSLRYMNGQAYLYYDISSRQNIAQLYNCGGITREWVKDFLWGMKHVGEELGRFLLDCHNIVWYPEQIFQELENNVFSFLYIPYYEGEDSFGAFLEFLAEHIDYEDEVLVECVYHMYDQYEKNGELYLQAKLFEDAAVLEQKKEPGKTSAAAKAEVQVPREEKSETPEETETEAVEAPDEKRGILGFFDSRRKKTKEQREDYRQSMHRAMEGEAVAEETVYEETEYGQTMYVELQEDTSGKLRGLYLPDGKLLCNLSGTVVTIGKKRGEADLVLEDGSVSRIHARIEKEKEYYYLEDMNSTNGTFKNGLRLQPYEKRRLEEGDDIRCGRVLFVFK
jgi:hypothetical protein